MSSDGGIVLRIEHLPTSRLQRLVSVAPSDTLKRAKTLFARHKYRQIPVLTGPSTPAGAITQEAVLSLDMTGRLLTLASVIRSVKVATMDEEVRKVFPHNSSHRFVLVRDRDDLISGIVTLSDAHRARQELSGPYLLIGEIELRLRRVLTLVCPSAEELQTATGKPRVQTAHELSLGDIEKALRRDDCWAKLGWYIDQEVFTGELNLVRNIRNQFAHYRLHGLPKAETNQLVGFLEWVEELAP
ncbi:CBS domain-containing protein [Streptosporangium minutum]|nr:CBS domain-containing protein [Streptosporangium minutum]